MFLNRTVGFTLVEFMVVLAIAAIFAAVAVPGYKAMIQNNKAAAAANKLSASLQLARMEAVRRGVPVAVCPTGNTSYTACGSNSQWSNGWIVFLDEDSDNSIDSNSDLVKVSQGFSNEAQVTTASTVISYDSSGFVTSGAATLQISAVGCTGNNGRTLSVSSSGRLSIQSASCN